MEPYLDTNVSSYKDYKEVFFSAKLELPKERDLLLNPPLPSDCDNWGRHRFSEYVVNNNHSDQL